MGGLLAARVLADFYERVTVVERDALYADAGQRKGVPQGRHFHTVLLRGARVLDGLFPGLTDDLVAAGAPRVNLLRQARVIVNGHQLASADTGSDAIQLTRPMLDGAVRERVAAIPAIKMLDGCDVVGVQANSGRVTGARIVNRTAANPREEVLAADLVVDAMGRAGRAAGWLPELGFTAPKEQRIKVDIAYTSRLLRLRPGALGADRLVLVGAMPGRTRGVALAAQEDDLWMLTAYGVAGDHPPLDEEGLLAFVKSAAPSDVYTAVLHATAETEPRQHKFPASIRRRYERLRAVPAGLLAFGDAICSFNPVYGQGMTVAAVESEVLRACLERGGDDLARRFFPRAAKVIDPVWQLNAGGDLALPEVPGHRPLATRLINRYVARAQRVGASDPDVATAFIRVGGLLDPPAAILAPRILARVIRGGRRRG
jgi:2-polyprenyl-6-methoxyphenol hydroxylase-like FAD-dependent oxidoreductase